MALAKQFGSWLSVLHVVDDDQPQALIAQESRAAEAVLRDELDRASVGDVAALSSVSVVAGDPFRAIADEAHRLDADLIVMGAHRKRLLGDIFTGTTIERVVRLGGRPVLMVNRDDDAAYSNVMAAVDLSEASAHALHTARSLGLLEPDRDAAVHGFVPLGEGMMYYAGVEAHRVNKHVAVSASQARTAITKFLRDHGFGKLSNLLLIEKGTPFAAIDVGIHQLQPDLLVIGTRGHGGLKRLLLGSVADEVLRRVECDILAVPASRNIP
ncbi:Universal stress protein [Sinorhizobium alkalisoli]|nr:Universal stress protein [Sinorhizobium alkalisoli]